MMAIPTRLRQREILNAQLTQCRRVDNTFTRGAAAALRWLTLGGPGPLTGALATPITFEAIVRELATAEAIIYGPPSDGRQYACGVEHALLWAESATSGPPVPVERRDRADSPGRSELFELTDAMRCADGPVRSLDDLTLVAEHRTRTRRDA